MPKLIVAVPSVIMKGETPNTATPMPLTTPTRVPAPTPARIPNVSVIAVASGCAVASGAMVSAVMTEVMATILPTERSKPPVSNASICPIETMAR